MKEIILLLLQNRSAETIRVILSQLFSPVVYTFRQIIEAHLFSPVSVEELAQKTNLSVSSFKREFRKLYNDSPANYLKNKRLEKSAALLLAANERITDIAYDCGFNDLANFTTAVTDFTVFTVGFDGAAAEPTALAAVARGHGLAATPAGSVSEALDLALRLGAGRVAICGSLYLAGEVLGASEETWPV